MRSIGRLDDRGRADRLADLLYAGHTSCEVREADEGFEIWVHDDARVPEAREVFAAFVAAPDDPRWAAAGEVARLHRAAEASADAAYRRRVALANRSLYGADGRGWLTLAVMGAAIVVAVLTQLGAQRELVGPLLISEVPFRLGLPEVRQGQVWRLVSPILLHFSVMHLGFNLYMWWSFAAAVEVVRGFRATLVLLLTAAVFSNGFQVLWDLALHPRGWAPFGGLSGVLYALFGYAWTKGRIDPTGGLAVPQQTATTLLVWLVLCMTGLLGPIANGAHLGGLIWGVLFAFADRALFDLRKRWRR